MKRFLSAAAALVFFVGFYLISYRFRSMTGNPANSSFAQRFLIVTATIGDAPDPRYPSSWSYTYALHHAKPMTPHQTLPRCLSQAAQVHLRLGWKASVTVLFALLAAVMPLSAQTVEQWQKAAVQKHPALAQAGSPLNQRFLAIVAEKRKSDPGYFAKPDWPVRAAEAAAEALQAKEQAAKNAETARTAEMTPDEREWERDKARWVFEKLVFGDSEEVIAKKLYQSKLIAARVPAKARMELASRFQWVLGESKFRLDFEMKEGGLAAINFASVPQGADALDSVIHEDWEKLRPAVVERFGPPAKSAEYPNAQKLQRGGWAVTDTWERPGSRMKLGVIEDGGKCSASLRISDPARAAE